MTRPTTRDRSTDSGSGTDKQFLSQMPRAAAVSPASPNRLSRSRLANRDALAAGTIVAVATGLIIFEALHQNVGSDFNEHMRMTQAGIDTGKFPGNPLFYLLNAALTGFSTNRTRLEVSLLFILAVATGAKAWLSVNYMKSEISRAAAGSAVASLASSLGMASAVVLGAFAFSLPGHYIYLGQIPANVWHNSTAVLLMPFAVALFWTSLSFLRSGETRYLWWSLLLAAVNIAIKPSFVLCFLPIFPLAAFVRFGWSSQVRRAWLVTGAVALVLALQYLYIYVADPTSEGGADSGGGVAIDPFRVWGSYTTSIPLSLLLSLVFPLVAVVVAGPVVRNSASVRYAGALALVGLVEFALLKETGAREYHGNFSWQAIVSMYVLFIALAGALLPWLQKHPWGIRQWLVVSAFSMHVVAGMHYLYHSFSSGSFVSG